MKEKRPLLWLSPASPCPLKPMDLGEKWQVHSLDCTKIPPVDRPDLPDIRLGILDLTHCPPSCLDNLDQWIDLLALPIWVGILAPGFEQDAQLKSVISRYCADYHTRPLDPLRMDMVLGHLWGMAGLAMVERSNATGYQSFALDGTSQRISQVRLLLRRFSRTMEPVLISGESGTGRDAAARYIHEHSARRHRQLVTVNCAALPVSLTQSELFGYEKGAFTSATASRAGRLEMADGSTLLLAGIDELHPEQQSSLLRFLQEGVVERIGANSPRQISARIIATSTRPLETVVKEGRFRQDVFYRLGELEIQMPPLRSRSKDIPMLVDRVLAAQKTGAGTKDLSVRAMQYLMEHDWPGNLRELQNRLSRALLLCDQPTIEAEDLGLSELPGLTRNLANLSLEQFRERAEQQAVSYSLALSRQNVSAAARILGISRVSLYRLMQKHGQQLSRRPQNNITNNITSR
ncbi:sigma 54-interacting transcriptional regulator [Marinobacter sp.]|uniref:sigma 54-interacting transcriptional regulator n=1 Tax=Marinobacter sp. TaxID=50741 RepID=UPI0038516C16